MRILGVLAAAVTLAASGAANAAPLTLQLSFTLQQQSGGNASGLNGANVLFTANFADGAMFYDAGCCSGQPQVDAASHSFVISGATNAASNGAFSDPNGASMYPNNGVFEGFFTSVGQFIALGGFLSDVSITAGMANVSIGDVLTLAILNAAFGGGLSGLDEWRTADGVYALSGFSFQAFETAVPLPAALPLFLAGLGALGFARRRPSVR